MQVAYVNTSSSKGSSPHTELHTVQGRKTVTAEVKGKDVSVLN